MTNSTILCNTFIADIDECKDPKLFSCHAKAKCFNTEASYKCTCNVGHVGDGKTCNGKYIILSILCT
jgi:hypothetical protein